MGTNQQVRRHWTRDPLLLGFVVSLLLHGLGYLGYKAGRRIHWDGQKRLLAMLVPKPSPQNLPLLKLYQSLLPEPKAKPTSPENKPKTRRDLPTVFISVDPSQAELSPPKDAKYYSDKNAVNANPSSKKASDIPQVDGKQKHVPQTVEIQKTVVAEPQPLQPAITAKKEPDPLPSAAESLKNNPLQKKQEEMKPKPKAAETPGNLAMLTPQKVPQKTDGKASTSEGKHERLQPAQEEQIPSRPRTVAEAKALLQKNQIAGEMLDQAGGVNRKKEKPSFDTRSTPHGSYDAVVVASIQQRWYQLLASNHYANDRTGHVTLDFKLYSDGSVRELHEVENTVGVILGAICQRAITDVAPFKAWPREMMQFFETNFREVRFTFYYD